MMYQAEDILEGARAIRPHLKTLLGEEAESLDKELGMLLIQAQEGQRVEVQIHSLLESHGSTREWLSDFMKDKRQQEEEISRLKSYEPLPGYNTVISFTLFRCPQCDYTWYRPSVGTPIPECPIHHISLVRVE